MTIYIILLTSFFILRIVFSINKKGKPFQDKKFVIIMAVLMGMILGLRGRNVGEDTASYILIFEDVKKISFQDILQYGYNVPNFNPKYHGTVEMFFLLINKLISFISPNPYFMFLTIGLVTCLLFAKFIIDNCDDYSLPVFVLMCDFIFMNAFNTMRQIFAMSIGIQAFYLIKKRKNIQALLVILIASCRHSSAVIYLSLFVIAFLSNNKQKYKLFKYCLTGCIILSLSLPILASIVSAVSPRYSFYLTNNIWRASVGGIAILWAIEFWLILLMYFKRFKIKDSFEYSICIMIYLTFDIIAIQFSGISRIGWYFRVFLICFFPIALKYFRNVNSYIIRASIYILLGSIYLGYANNSARAYSFFWN